MKFGRIGRTITTSEIMNKYIEELSNGDAFKFESEYFLLTSDFKKNGNRLGISLNEGFSRWFEGNLIIAPIQLYTMDIDNNIIPLKPTKKEDVNTKN